VCGSALTLASKGTGYEQYRYQCNLRKRSRGLICSTVALNGALVDPVVLKLLLRGLRVRLNQIRAAAPQLAGGPDAESLPLERDHLLKRKARILENYEEGLYGEGALARAERDGKLSPILKRLAQIDRDLASDVTAQEDKLGQALANIENLWADFPTFVKRDILRTYVPEGFRLMPGRRLRAEVCGILLEVDIPRNDATQKGLRYGGRQKRDGQTASSDPAVNSTVPPHRVSGGMSRSGGI
ncbi:MAG: hypothetical protein VKN33_01480, partial [Candidatus Sericytochromatia bacterium]|nr:hypothetical protein [Candidatus Sericytochromatia bacterium]